MFISTWANSLLDVIASKSKESPKEHDLQLLVYFDEAYYLTEIHRNIECSAYKALCNALGELSDFDMMGLFISKSPNLVKLITPESGFWLSYGREDAFLQPPFVEFPYRDENQERIVEGGTDTTLPAFCTMAHIVSLSRPL